MINFLDKLIPLLLGHFVADFAIQTDTVALNKCPKNKSKISWVWWDDRPCFYSWVNSIFFNRFFLNCTFGSFITFLY